MKTLAFLILAVFGGVALYDESPEFRQTIDNMVAEIEAEHPNFATHYANPEMESVAFDRADAFRTSSTAPASSTVSRPGYGSGAGGTLSERRSRMNETYNQAVRTLRTQRHNAPDTTQHMTDYYGARYSLDQGRNAYRETSTYQYR